MPEKDRKQEGECLEAGENRTGEFLVLEPVMKENIWGGNRLVTEFPYHMDSDTVGECWGISAHPNGDCKIREGTYQGWTLSKLYAEHRELFGNITADRFPLLVKIIDAKEKLSIQVHPDDAYAYAHEKGSSGKNECWYIMDCPENAKLVIGHHAKTREELVSLVEEGRYEELIRHIPVRKGDFISIEPGTVHAIMEGILLLETQQSSDITYRVYDYGRLQNGSPRPLHVAQSLEVIKVPDRMAENAVLHTEDFPRNELRLLTQCSFYSVWKLSLTGEFSFEQAYPFLLISVLEGSGEINGRPFSKGAHLILPSGFGKVDMTGDMELILSTQTTEPD